MNCKQYQKRLLQYIENLLSNGQKHALEKHLEQCENCQIELKQIKKIQHRLIQDGENLIQSQRTDQILSYIAHKTNPHSYPKQIKFNWRVMMKQPKIKLALVPGFAIVLIILSILFFKSAPSISAAELLSSALEAISEIHSVYMKAEMRTRPNDNFSSIDLTHDFVPIEMWKMDKSEYFSKWRIQKPERVAVMNGEKCTMLFSNKFVNEIRSTNYCFDTEWCGRLLNIIGLLQNELHRANSNKNMNTSVDIKSINGKRIMILTLEISTDEDLSHDYLKNKFLSTSNHKRIYYFNEDTNLLENFEIKVKKDHDYITVFSLTNIKFNDPICPSVFELDLPTDALWIIEPEEESEYIETHLTDPVDVAKAFFLACSMGDWESYKMFKSIAGSNSTIIAPLKNLKILHIGKPFQSKTNLSMWFIPYKVKFQDGSFKENNLAIRNDNNAQQWCVDGGF
ncbi:anti-sigma factor family protein [bacterium]